MTELERYRDALERIVAYDPGLKHGYTDEWTEAEAFSAVQEIAQDALVPGTIAAREAHERSVANAQRAHAKQLRKESSAGVRHFLKHAYRLAPVDRALILCGAWVCVLNQKHERPDLVYVKIESIVGQRDFVPLQVGEKYEVNIGNLFHTIEEIPA